MTIRRVARRDSPGGTLITVCPTCNHPARASAAAVGKKARCPACHQTFLVGPPRASPSPTVRSWHRPRLLSALIVLACAILAILVAADLARQFQPAAADPTGQA